MVGVNKSDELFVRGRIQPTWKRAAAFAEEENCCCCSYRGKEACYQLPMVKPLKESRSLGSGQKPLPQ